MTVINQGQQLPGSDTDTWLEWVRTTSAVDYYAADWTVPQTPVKNDGSWWEMPNIFIFNAITSQDQPSWIIQPVLRWNVDEYMREWSGRVYYVKGEGEDADETYLLPPFPADEGDRIRGSMKYMYSDGRWTINMYNVTSGNCSSFGTDDFGTANNHLWAALEARGKSPANIDDADIPGTIQFTNMQATYNSNPITTDWETVNCKVDPDCGTDYPLISYLHPTLDSDTNPTTCTLYTSGGRMTVETGSATNIGSISATLNGNLTHFGPDTSANPSAQVSFDYGTDPDLDTFTPTPTQTKTETGSFQQTITNLNPGTAYYFRAKAQGAKSGTVYGDIRHFPTIPSPPPPPPPDTTPPTVSITSPTNGQTFTTPSITVSGTAQDNVAVSKVEVQVGSGGWQQASGTTSWSLQVTLNSGSNTIYARATDTSNNVTPTPASVTVTYNPPLDITTTSLPAGILDVPYSQTLQAEGGTGTYTWSILSGALPDGLALNPSTGAISGTPIATGTYNFTAQVNDGTNTDDQPLSIVISSTPPPTAPTVTNSTGESDVTSTSARLNGEITDTGGEDPTVIIYWGTSDGGTDPLNWSDNVSLETQPAGIFYTDINSLTPDTDYFYRCYATNSAGESWADSTEPFHTAGGSSTAATYPGTAASQSVDIEDGSWQNPANIKADDGNFSETLAVIPGTWYSGRLKATNFSFSIPSGATIDGIKVEIERREDNAGLNAHDYRVQLLDADGNLVGVNKKDSSEWSTSYEIITYGGSTDTWGASPTRAMVEDPNFGVCLSVKMTPSSYGLKYARVDFIRMTIYYTAGGG